MHENMPKKKIPACGHTGEVSCSKDPSTIRCSLPCDVLLPCGDKCTAECHVCTDLSKPKDMSGYTQRIERQCHPNCSKICGRVLSCRHECASSCHSLGGKDYPPCKRKCDILACDHSECSHECTKLCQACAEPCKWECSHKGKCPMPCGIPCIRLPCNERCTLKLKCGHQCPSVCGESCPDVGYCIDGACANKPDNTKIQDKVIDLYELKTYGEIDVNENPIIVLPCKHAFTMQSLDGRVDLNSFYEMDNDDQCIGLKELPTDFMSFPTCPYCRHSGIRFIRRYGRAMKRAVNDAAEKKFIALASQHQAQLETGINKLEDSAVDEAINRRLGRNIVSELLKAPADNKYIFKSIVKKHWEDFQKTSNAVDSFAKSMKNAPLQVAYESAMATIQRTGSAQPADFQLPPGHTRYTVAAHLYRARLSVAMVDVLLEAHCQIMMIPHADIMERISKLVCGEIDAYLKNALIACNEAENKARINNAYARILESKLVSLDYYRRLCLMPYRSYCSDHSETCATGLGLCQELLNPKTTLPSFYAANVNKIMAMQTFFEQAKKGIISIVSAGEKRMIRKVMELEFGPGGSHWYRCPTGHPYAIGECGGAMEQSSCPECGETIGGQRHSLTTNNTAINDFGA